MRPSLPLGFTLRHQQSGYEAPSSKANVVVGHSLSARKLARQVSPAGPLPGRLRSFHACGARRITTTGALCAGIRAWQYRVRPRRSLGCDSVGMASGTCKVAHGGFTIVRCSTAGNTYTMSLVFNPKGWHPFDAAPCEWRSVTIWPMRPVRGVSTGQVLSLAARWSRPDPTRHPGTRRFEGCAALR